MKNMLKLKSKRIFRALAIFILGFTLYEIYQFRKYIQIFDIQTFLPQRSLPLQLYSEKPTCSYSSHNNFDDLRIVCLIVTSPKYHQSRAVHVGATWAKHCKRKVYLTSEKDSALPDSYVIKDAGGYYDLWEKVSKGFKLVYENEPIYDWVLKVDDDTFVFLEHLIEALKPYNPDRLYTTGHKLYSLEKENDMYFNGGAGYALSRGAVKEFVSKGLRRKSCEKNLELGRAEDVNMARCLAYLGVNLLDLRDPAGRVLFHIYPPQEQIDPRQLNSWSHLWLKIKSVHPNPFGLTNMTNRPITFHYVNAETMYLLYYLSYVIRPCV